MVLPSLAWFLFVASGFPIGLADREIPDSAAIRLAEEIGLARGGFLDAVHGDDVPSALQAGSLAAAAPSSVARVQQRHPLT